MPQGWGGNRGREAVTDTQDDGGQALADGMTASGLKGGAPGWGSEEGRGHS